MMRLNLGCGLLAAKDWVNLDIEAVSTADVRADARSLPFRDASFVCAVANHSLSSVEQSSLVDVLADLRRVLAPNAPLRILDADIVGAFEAYRSGDRGWFLNKHETLDETFCTYVTWYSERRSVFTPAYLELLLRRAGFSSVVRAVFGATAASEPSVVDLDHRRRESLIVEAWCES